VSPLEAVEELNFGRGECHGFYAKTSGKVEVKCQSLIPLFRGNSPSAKLQLVAVSPFQPCTFMKRKA
jgi:hypothetical protein